MKKLLLLILMLQIGISIYAVEETVEPYTTEAEQIGQINYEAEGGGMVYLVPKDGAWNISGTACKYVYFDRQLTEQAKKEMMALVMMAYALGKKVIFHGTKWNVSGSTYSSYFIVNYVIVTDQEEKPLYL